MTMINKEEPPIIILDVELTEEDFPKLYKWAKKNPKWLEENLKSMADAENSDNYAMMAVCLESDLQHG
ncbi:hypothetical protein CL644_00700 [bacterium]|nr:hypothetical protein [bacterium]|tara:strand:- start:10121 stop:10324 length:204 start_codon:yes stop_codon:yes gene_type:complete